MYDLLQVEFSLDRIYEFIWSNVSQFLKKFNKITIVIIGSINTFFLRTLVRVRLLCPVDIFG